MMMRHVTMDVYEIRPRKDHRGVDLISDVLPFDRLWYGGPNAVANAIGYAMHSSRSHDAVIRVYVRLSSQTILSACGPNAQLIKGARTREMSLRPSSDRHEQMAEISTLVCQFVGITHRTLLVR